MDDRFFNAFLPPTVRIAGRDLTRFTLWHQFILAAIGSPIMSGEGSFGIPDLVAAVKVCRASYGPAPNMSPTLWDLLWTMRYRRDHALFKRHAKSLFEWVGLQCSPPKYWRAATGQATVCQQVDNAPRCLALVVSLMTRAGMSRAEAWDSPIGEARWIDLMIAKNEVGGIHFLDDADLDDSPISFDTMTDEEALAQFKRDLPAEIAMNTFEKWKQERRDRDA